MSKELREQFEEETKEPLYYWFQKYSGASMEEHGFSEEYVEWLESNLKESKKFINGNYELELMQSFAEELKEKECTDLEWSLYKQVINLKDKLKEADKAIYFISQLGIEGAKRQTLEEIGNSDTDTERDFYYNVLEKIKENELNKQ